MRHVARGLVLTLFAFGLSAHASDKPVPGHYLFAWAGDVSNKSNDFLAVIDAAMAKSIRRNRGAAPTDRSTYRRWPAASSA